MNTCYLELRQKISTLQRTDLAADIARHLQSRQHLGKAIVICDKPLSLLSVTRKHWLKQARVLQKQRASTINAEKILRLTNSITHMHRMIFVARPPEDQPNAHVFFMEASEVGLLPINTFSLYLTCQVQPATIAAIQQQLPAEALLIDYTGALKPHTHLQPKDELRTRVIEEWEQVLAFLTKHDINVHKLVAIPREIGVIDDTLDTLLGISRQFLQVASTFQRTLELAQPTQLDSIQQHHYDMLALLAHRVQALSPQIMPHRFTYDLNEDETFFLHDVAVDSMTFTEALALAINHHRRVGRNRLAQALTFVQH